MKRSTVVVIIALVVGAAAFGYGIGRADDDPADGSGPASSVPLDDVDPDLIEDVSDLGSATTSITSPSDDSIELTYEPREFFTSDNPLPEPSASGSEGAFRISCRGGHLNYDDPIVFPDQPGASHLHQYFGNLSVDAATTLASIEASGETTCHGGPLNRSGYWVPALIDGADESVIPVDIAIVYYKGEPAEEGSPMIGSVSPLPENIAMVTDDFTWSCGDDRIGTDCSTMILTVRFGWCWNGELDSPDHRSHLVFPDRDDGNTGQTFCPDTHPTPIPRITYNVHYDATLASPSSNWYLASDLDPAMATRTGQDVPAIPGSTAHGDYMEGWGVIDPQTGETADRVWWRECLVGFRDSSSGRLCDGRNLIWPGSEIDEPTVSIPPNDE